MKQLISSLIVLPIAIAGIISVAHADVVSMGDAQIDLDKYGAISSFQINGHSSPLFYADNYFAINGAAPLPLFGLTSTGLSVDGNTGTAIMVDDSTGTDLMSVRVSIELNNPQQGDRFAEVDFRVDFTNLGPNPMDLQYYAYLDFDVDSIHNTVETASFDGTTFQQRNLLGLTGREIEVTAKTQADHWEINEAANVYSKLTVVEKPFDLADGTNDLETDIEFTMQHKRLLAPGNTASIEFSVGVVPVTAVPEPTINFLLAIATAPLLLRRTHRSKRPGCVAAR